MLTNFTTSLLLITGTLAHMSLFEPAPRRSNLHPGYSPSQFDPYMSSPLGGKLTYPCRGEPAGPIYSTYEAGSDINTVIGGKTFHKGGHCQYSISYDNENFVALKTVFGDCISESLNHKVTLPKDAPNGKAIFVWTWVPRQGGRDFYMNCVDIEIKNGSDNGQLVGHKMLVANINNGPVFPEFYNNTYGTNFYTEQPVISIAPNRNPIVLKVKSEPEVIKSSQ